MMALSASCAAPLLALVLMLVSADLDPDAGACESDDIGVVAACMEERCPARGALLLQVRHKILPTHSRSPCDFGGSFFDAAHCHELTLGVKDPRQLLEVGTKAGGMGLLGRGPANCRRKFHALSLEETERLEPSLHNCLVSTWAAKMYSSLAVDPCTEDSLEKADLVVLPGYTAVECNWPIYGGGDCRNSKDGMVNMARDGATCRDPETLEAYRRIQKVLGKQVVVLENSPNPNGNKYDLPDDSIYAEPNLSWAFVGADTKHYRFGADVSVPPGPSLRCRLSVPSSRSARSFDEELERKPFLASFKGGFDMHPFRLQARDALHDGQKIIIADRADGNWDFDDLLFGSVFSLILRGDAIMTTRINEAVCSGGIPVLVTDSWIPPFNETVPFETFGLIHDENDVGSLRGRLEGVSAEERAKLRKAARSACERNFQTIDAHAESLAQAVTQIVARAGA